MLIHELLDHYSPGDFDHQDPAIQELMNTSIDVCDDFERAERLLLNAIGMFPEQLEISVALYKMYAFFNHIDESLALVDEVLAKAAAQMGVTANWRQLDGHSAQWEEARGAVRIFLFSLKARGFVALRMGDVEGALQVLRKLEGLDPADQVGGATVLEMAERVLDSDVGSAA